MRIQYLPCRHCGRKWRPGDEVNVLRSYCSCCSKERGADADRWHATHVRSIVRVGGYTLLTPVRPIVDTQKAIDAHFLQLHWTGGQRIRCDS
jgi:hypothetical protein